MNGPKVPRGTLGFVEKNRFRSTFDETPFYFLVFSHAVQPRSGRRPWSTVDRSHQNGQRNKHGPKVFYYVDLRSVHSARSGKCFGQSVNKSLCDTLPEAFFSKVSPGRDQIDKPRAELSEDGSDDSKAEG